MKHPATSHSLTDRLAALGELVRLRMLRLLEREELSVGEVAKVVQLPQSTVSRHLKVLADGAWIVKRSEGTATYYRVVLDDLPELARGLWVAVRAQLESAEGGHAGELAEDVQRLASVLAERREDSQGFFGRVAGQWDDVRSDLFGTRLTLQGLLSLIPPGWTVADLGCGTGNAAELLSPLVQRVIAVDQSEPMLNAAKKRLEGLRNVTFRRGELEKLPLEDGEADAAVMLLALHHVESPAEVLREMRRVLRTGGVGLVVDMAEHDRTSYRHTMGHRWLGFSEAGITRELQDAGFVATRYTRLPPDTQAKGPGLFACTAYARA